MAALRPLRRPYADPGIAPVQRRELWAWAGFDFANSGYTTVVITAIFSAYFVGVVAGGLADGTVGIWDPSKLVAGHAQPRIAAVQRHTGPVNGLHFNPTPGSSHLLASGGADNEVFVLALDRPDAPNVFIPAPAPNTAKHTAEVAKYVPRALFGLVWFVWFDHGIQKQCN